MGDEKDISKDTNKSVIGEHSDKAIADIVRALLQKPAETTGEMISDTIGLFGDRIKAKRQLNAQLGLEAVRKRLESNNSDLEEIIPPDEEDLHLLVNGLSLAGNDTLRGLWAGLFAKSLEPNSGVTAERPFIQILESLSPTDAAAFDFLVYAYDANEKIENELRDYIRSNPNQSGVEQASQDNILNARQKALDRFVKKMEAKISNHGLDALNDEHWDENLVRLGLIERILHQKVPRQNIQIRSGSAHEVHRAFEGIIRAMDGLSELVVKTSQEKVKLYEKRTVSPQFGLHVRITPFGDRFARACGIVG